MQIYNQNYTKTVTIVTQVFFLFMLKKSIYPKIQRNQNSYLYIFFFMFKKCFFPIILSNYNYYLYNIKKKRENGFTTKLVLFLQ